MIWSDNGTNFTGAEKELRPSICNWKKETIQNEMRSKEIEWEICPIYKWRFQPPAASHMIGGLGTTYPQFKKINESGNRSPSCLPE